METASTLERAGAIAARLGRPVYSGGGLSGVCPPEIGASADLSAIAELNAIDAHDSGLMLGEAVTLAAAADHLPAALRLALTGSLPSSVLPKATIGESLTERRCPALASWWASLLALDACVELYFAETPARLMTGLPAFSRRAPDFALVTALYVPPIAASQRLAAVSGDDGACAAWLDTASDRVISGALAWAVPHQATFGILQLDLSAPDHGGWLSLVQQELSATPALIECARAALSAALP